MNPSSNLSPESTLAFAAALPPHERQNFLEHLTQRPWSEQQQTNVVLCSLGIHLKQVQALDSASIDSASFHKGLDHFVIERSQASKTPIKIPPWAKTNIQKPPQTKRYYRYPPQKQYTLDEAFATDQQEKRLPPFLALNASIAQQSKDNQSAATSSFLAKKAIFTVDKRPVLSGQKISVPSAQSPIAKGKHLSRRKKTAQQLQSVLNKAPKTGKKE